VIGGHGAAALRAWAKVRGTASADQPFFLARRFTEGEVVRAMNVASVDYIVRKNGRAAGLGGVHAHSLRHTAASLALSGGASLVEVREMLGHSSILTTSRYLHVVEGQQRARAVVYS
jgi:integrase